MGLGLQHKSVDEMEKELELPVGQLLGLFNRSIRKFVQVRYLSLITLNKKNWYCKIIKTIKQLLLISLDLL